MEYGTASVGVVIRDVSEFESECCRNLTIFFSELSLLDSDLRFVA